MRGHLGAERPSPDFGQCTEPVIASGDKTKIESDIFFVCDDIGAVEDQADAEGWDISYTQLEKGRFRGRYEAWECPGLLITHEAYSRKAIIAGTAPSDRVSLIVPSRSSGPLGVDGRFFAGLASRFIQFKTRNFPVAHFGRCGTGEDKRETLRADGLSVEM